MSVLQTVHLSVEKFAPQAIIHAVQNDTDRQVEMIIDDYILDAGATGKITFERSDFTHYEAPATFDLSNNSFTAEIDQALTRFGETKVQLKVDGNDGRVSTFTFLIYVQRDTTGVATEQSAVDIKDAIEAAEAAVSHYPYVDPETNTWFIWDVELGEFVDTEVTAHGEDGFSPVVTVTDITGGHRVEITDADGTQAFDVMDGTGGGGDGGATYWSSVQNKPFETLDSQTLTVNGGMLAVNTTNDVENGGAKPVTAAGVNVVVGNINTLLSMI